MYLAVDVNEVNAATILSSAHLNVRTATTCLDVFLSGCACSLQLKFVMVLVTCHFADELENLKDEHQEKLEQKILEEEEEEKKEEEIG